MSLQNQVAIVTGASRGIGRAIALELAKQGATVIGTATSESGAAGIGEALQQAGGKGRGAVLNVNDAAAADAFIDGIVKEFGALNVLVNNAGITKDQLAMRMKDDEFDAVIDTNLRAVFRLSRAVLRPMMKARGGRIINITSVSGQAGQMGQANYSSAKAGLIGLTKATARELASRGITCNAVAPGFVLTELTKDLPEPLMAEITARTPLGRFGTTEEIADAVAFLVSDEAGYITGQVLAVDGGLVMM